MPSRQLRTPDHRTIAPVVFDIVFGMTQIAIRTYEAAVDDLERFFNRR